MTSIDDAQTPPDDAPETSVEGAEAGTELGEPFDEADTSGEGDGPRRWYRTHWVFTRRLCFGGLAGALVFSCLSMTPSLLPRAAIMQGVVIGVAVAIGYGLGSMLSSLIRKVIPREPSARFKGVAWWVLHGSTIVLGGLFLDFGIDWQRDIRDLMGMEQLGATGWFSITVLTALISYLLLVMSRLIRGGTRAMIRFGDRFFDHTVTVNISA